MLLFLLLHRESACEERERGETERKKERERATEREIERERWMKLRKGDRGRERPCERDVFDNLRGAVTLLFFLTCPIVSLCFRTCYPRSTVASIFICQKKPILDSKEAFE